MKNILLILFCAWAFKANAEVADTNKSKLPDTTKRVSTYDATKPGTYLPPVILVAYGGLSFVIKPVRNFDYYVKGRIEKSAPTFYTKIDDYMQLSPAVLVYGLNLAGVKGKHRFGDRTALLALSGGILTVADGLKYLGHRNRPYNNDPLSFPSGHTGAAFLAAEYLAQEYGDQSPLYSVLGYSIATTTAVLRLYDRAHWFSDIAAGAGLGILSVKASYLLYPHIRNWFSHKDKQGRSTMIMPTYQYGAPGLAFSMQL